MLNLANKPFVLSVVMLSFIMLKYKSLSFMASSAKIMKARLGGERVIVNVIKNLRQ